MLSRIHPCPDTYLNQVSVLMHRALHMRDYRVFPYIHHGDLRGHLFAKQ